MSTAPKYNPNVFEQRSRVTDEDRARLFKQRGCVVWFTGLPGSGKSTLAQALELELIRTGHPSYILDGDNIRRGLNSDLGFSDEDRSENIRRVAEVAALFADCDIICMAAFISPFIADRQAARKIIGDARFLEVYLSTSLSECEKRDPKGLYKKARSGKLAEFTGISSPYEPPPSPELIIDTLTCGVAESCSRMIDVIRKRNFLF